MAKRLTTKQIRMRLATRETCDDPACPGWAVFNGCEIQRCDTCCPASLTDADVASLPEAGAALTAVLEGPAPSPRRHRHRVKITQDVAYRYPVRITGQVAEAHGGITEIAVCACGATRLSNHNQGWAEIGEWQDPAEGQS